MKEKLRRIDENFNKIILVLYLISFVLVRVNWVDSIVWFFDGINTIFEIILFYNSFKILIVLFSKDKLKLILSLLLYCLAYYGFLQANIKYTVIVTLSLIIHAYYFKENKYYKLILKLFIFGFILALVGVKFGFVEQTINTTQGRYRIDLGLYHPNFVGMIFFVIYSLSYYLFLFNRKKIALILGTIMILFIYFVVDSRTACLAIALLMILICLKDKINIQNKYIKYIFILMPVLLFIFSLVLTMNGDKVKGFIDGNMSMRFYFPWLYIKENGIQLINPNKFNIDIDNLWMNVLCRGVTKAIAIIILFMVTSWKIIKDNNKEMFIILLTIYVYSLMEATWQSALWNWTFYILTDEIRKGTQTKKEKEIQIIENSDYIESPESIKNIKERNKELIRYSEHFSKDNKFIYFLNYEFHLVEKLLRDLKAKKWKQCRRDLKAMLFIYKVENRHLSYEDNDYDEENYIPTNNYAGKKIVVYTAIFGKYELTKEPEFVSDRCDYVALTDFDLPENSVWKKYDLSKIKEVENLTPYQTARWCKMHPHILFPEYDYSIWVDGNITLVGDIYPIIDRVDTDKWYATFNNPWRDNVFTEANAIKFYELADEKTVDEQIDFYKKDGIEPIYFYEDSIIIRQHNNQDCIKMMDDWWEQINTFTMRDQLSLPYVVWKNNFGDYVQKFNGTWRMNPRFKFNEHTGKRIFK